MSGVQPLEQVLVAKLLNLTPFFFAGFVMARLEPVAPGLSLGAQAFSKRDTLSRFCIKKCGLAGATALFGQGVYDESFLVPALTQEDGLPYGDVLAGFDALPIDLYLAAFNRFFGQTSRPVKTGCP
jgi:hypothetical protein